MFLESSTHGPAKRLAAKLGRTYYCLQCPCYRTTSSMGNTVTRIHTYIPGPSCHKENESTPIPRALLLVPEINCRTAGSTTNSLAVMYGNERATIIASGLLLFNTRSRVRKGANAAGNTAAGGMGLFCSTTTTTTARRLED